MRRSEGDALGKIPRRPAFGNRRAHGAGRGHAGEENPRRSSAACREIAELLDGSQRFDADRLHQEAILLAKQG